ncbi:MAG: hypothetical protein KDE27_24355 [Planctomycetes bacterium]|nr:hypothetical protein [Planctomycetota bacterium]
MAFSFRRVGVFFAVAGLAGCGAGAGGAMPRTGAPAVIAGLDAAGLTGALRGRVLLGELGCVRCHASGDHVLGAASGPSLTTVAGRIDQSYLVEFLQDPRTVEAGTTMPDLLRDMQGPELAAAADALAHYLRSFSSGSVGDVDADVAEPEVDEAARQRGEELYRRVGCRACHDNDDARRYLDRKYSTAALNAFLLAPHAARPAQRMPDFGLAPAEAHDLTQFLQTLPRARTAPLPVDTAKAAAGRTLFGARGCAACHELADESRRDAPAAKPLDQLDALRGCLSETAGTGPAYDLTAAQRSDLRAALAALGTPATGNDLAIELLARRRCLVCHRRGDVDAVTAGLARDLFGTDDPTLGEEGRMPPPLTGVGAKLQREWLTGAIAHGQRERPYLHMRMPGFGVEFAAQLADLLTTVDAESGDGIAPLPEDRDAAEAVKTVGRELVSDGGMNCISCHRFAGEQAGSMAAIDLVYSTGERLRPEWFARFLRDPFRFKPNTLMPHFFPDGRSTRPAIADGDVDRQIAGLWHYLAEGRNVRRPTGLRPPPIELTVADEAVMLRRSVQHTGKRGISVGYPGGVNVTFDAERLGLNQVWWGRFVDARPVWTSQGSGEAQILSQDRAELPNGPAFAALPAADAPWPAATRRERGDAWRGYDLDAARRPTLRYTFGDVAIADTPSEMRVDGGRTTLRRTLRLTGPAASLWFRAARDARIERLDARTVRVGRALLVASDTPAEIVAIPGDDARELRFAVQVAPDGASLELEYRWQEDGR